MTQRGRKRTRSVRMPPKYRSSSNSTSVKRKRPGSRTRMRPWLENLLDRKLCQGVTWVDKEERIFAITWRHASSHGFDQTQHGDVFSRWAQHTGKLDKNSVGDHSSNKSTFRCALNSLKDCIQTTGKGEKRGEQARRTYQFIDENHPEYDKKRRKTKSNRKKQCKEDSLETTAIEDTSDFQVNAQTSPASPASDSIPSVQGIFSGQDIAPNPPIPEVDTILTYDPANNGTSLFLESESSLLDQQEADDSLIWLDSSGQSNVKPVPHFHELCLDNNSEHHTIPAVTDETISDKKSTPKLMVQMMPDGIFCFELQNGIVPDQNIALTKLANTNNHTLPDFPALGVDPYVPLSNISIPMFGSGGMVKIMPVKQEVPNLPEYEINQTKFSVVMLQRAQKQHQQDEESAQTERESVPIDCQTEEIVIEPSDSYNAEISQFDTANIQNDEAFNSSFEEPIIVQDVQSTHDEYITGFHDVSLWQENSDV